MSDCPRTDAAKFPVPLAGGNHFVVFSSVAEDLECENAALREQLSLTILDRDAERAENARLLLAFETEANELKAAEQHLAEAERRADANAGEAIRFAEASRRATAAEAKLAQAEASVKIWRDDLAQANAKLVAVEQDVERLNWLEEHGGEPAMLDLWLSTGLSGFELTFRVAIDRARVARGQETHDGVNQEPRLEPAPAAATDWPPIGPDEIGRAMRELHINDEE